MKKKLEQKLEALWKGEVDMKDEDLEQTEVERKILKKKLEQKLEALWKGEVDMKDEDLEQTEVVRASTILLKRHEFCRTTARGFPRVLSRGTALSSRLLLLNRSLDPQPSP